MSNEPMGPENNWEPSDRAKFILSLCRDPYAKKPSEIDEPLNDEERQRFERLESFVVDNFATFYAVGCALREIDRKRLYREKAPTFQKYCRLIETQAAYAYRLISAADVIDDLQERIPSVKMSPIGDKYKNESNQSHSSIDFSHIDESTDASDIYVAPDSPPPIPLPANEAQARPLSKVKDPVERAAVWMEAVREARGPRVTATDVKRAITRRHSETVQAAVQKAAETLIYTPAINRASDSFKAAFEAFLNEIYTAQHTKWRDTSLEHVTACLDMLREAVAPESYTGETLPMPSADSVKAQKAGFSLYRADRSMMAIKKLDANGNWRKHSQTFRTVGAMNRELAIIMQNPMAIMG